MEPIDDTLFDLFAEVGGLCSSIGGTTLKFFHAATKDGEGFLVDGLWYGTSTPVRVDR